VVATVLFRNYGRSGPMIFGRVMALELWNLTKYLVVTTLFHYDLRYWLDFRNCFISELRTWVTLYDPATINSQYPNIMKWIWYWYLFWNPCKACSLIIHSLYQIWLSINNIFYDGHVMMNLKFPLIWCFKMDFVFHFRSLNDNFDCVIYLKPSISLVSIL
jgi:hypothetical protein